MYENVVSTVKLDYRWWIVLVRQLYAGSSILLVTGLSEILYIYIDLYTGPHHTISIKKIGKIYYIDHKIKIYYICPRNLPYIL